MENPTSVQPLDFSSEIPAANVGMRPESIAALATLFEEQVTRQRLHPAAQLVVLRHGRVVLDRALGQLDQGPVTPETPFLTFSVSKVFTSMCIHRLIEEERVAWDAPVATYWPEFGCKGKERATIRHVLLHQAGIPAPGVQRQIWLWPFWGAVTRSVARLRAEFEPGTQTAYHLVNYGFILGEVIRRVTGLPMNSYLQQTFLAPLGLRRTWMRLPRSMMREAALLFSEDNPWISRSAALFNRPYIRRALLPATSLHSTARDLATFFQMLLNGGIYGGQRVLKPETIAAATALGYDGFDGFLRTHMRWGHGFILGGGTADGEASSSEMGRGSTVRTFGGFGMSSCMVWADPDAGVVVAFTCNRLLESQRAAQRWAAISEAVWDSL